MLKGKNILLGVSGSIAAYKSALICRELIKQGANVKVLMTPSAVNFITPLTLSTLSKNPVYLEYFDSKDGSWNNHVELAKWADFLLLAPATQNTIAKMANGICDNLLLATYFSMESRVYFAPAMDLDMFKHPANQANISKLKENGNILIPSGTGELASGLSGEGRMAEVEDILSAIGLRTGKLDGKTILITAGPTYEAIDPVRFIGNHSSGKMGFALANEATKRGARVILVSGPTSLTPPVVSKLIKVTTAKEMFDAVDDNKTEANAFIMSAAVSDFTTKNSSEKKIKKSDNDLNISLKPTKDILKYIGGCKTEQQFLIGFALETNDEESNAQKKLKEKNCDFIVLNSLQNKGSGFGVDTNQIVIFEKGGGRNEFALKSKNEVAIDIIDLMESKWLD